MASLFLLRSPFPITTTTSTHKTPRHFVAKPSPVEKTGPGFFQVLCKADNHDQNAEISPGKLDRRNLLFGLGGFYGAANLVSAPPAPANPVQAPELNKCSVAVNLNDPNRPVLKESCCPPLSTQIIDYQLPPVRQMKVRPTAHRVTRDYILKYNRATSLMRNLPAEDPRNFRQQANIHCAYCNGAHDQPGHSPPIDFQVHNSWLFFPFHRWYLYFYERILGELVGDPTFALPFWNWDNPKGMSVPKMFLNTAFSIYDEKRNPDNAKSDTIVDLGLTGTANSLQVISNNLTSLYTEMVRGVATLEDFMGKPYRDGSDPDPGPGTSERGSHTSVHAWVGDPRQPSGEDLGNFYSAGRDPLFYCHHANVDRMWSIFRNELQHPNIPDKDFSNEPDFLDASFLFYDEKKRLCKVQVRDCLDHARMGYEYEKVDLPWMSYRPAPQTRRARVARSARSIGAPNASDVFPATLYDTIRVMVPKSQKGQADEVLVLENITVDTSRLIKFDVFVNDEDDDDLTQLDRAAFAGTFAEVPHKTKNTRATTGSITLKLTELYNGMDIDDDESIMVTIVPRVGGEFVNIGNVKITPAPVANSPST